MPQRANAVRVDLSGCISRSIETHFKTHTRFVRVPVPSFPNVCNVVNRGQNQPEQHNTDGRKHHLRRLQHFLRKRIRLEQDKSASTRGRIAESRDGSLHESDGESIVESLQLSLRKG